MSKRLRTVLVWILFFLLLGIMGVLGYNTQQLNHERDALAADLEIARHRFRLLQQKYAEQKAQTAAVQRANLATEGKLRQVRQELTAIQAERETLDSQIAAIEENHQKKVAGLEKNIEKYKEQLQKLVENRDQYKGKLAETVAIVKERNAMIHELTAEKQDIETALQGVRFNLGRCVKHNSRLSQLAEELTHAYYSKKVGGGVEPFTQIKKVEIEKLVQEYLGRIDNENLEIINQSAQ